MLKQNFLLATSKSGIASAPEERERGKREIERETEEILKCKTSTLVAHMYMK